VGYPVGFSERIAAAWRAMRAGSSEVQRAHDILARILQGSQPPRKGSRELLLAYRDTPWLRAAASRIGSAVASTPWRLYAAKRSGTARAVGRLPGPVQGGRDSRSRELGRLRAAGELREIESHPLLDLLHRPNPVMAGAAARKLLQLWLDIKGEGFAILERNAAGMPVEMWPVPPHWIADIGVGTRPFRASYLAWQREIPASDVLWLRDLDAENPYGRGSGVGEALADELSADEYAAKMVAAKLFNAGVPDMMVGIESASGDDARELKARWEREHRGPSKQGGIFVYPKGKMTIEKLSPTFVDLALNDLRSWQRNIVVQVFGMPPEILGIIENSNRSTIDCAEYLFARGVVVPRLEMLRSDLQERLVPEFDEKLILDYDSPVPEDREFKAKAMQGAPFAFMLDEHRELAGFAALDGQRGQVFPVPTGTGFAPDPSKVKPATPTVGLLPGRALPADPAWARRRRVWAVRPGWNSRVWERSVLRAQDDAAAGFRDDVVIPLFRAQLDRLLAMIPRERVFKRDDEEGTSLVDAILAELDASKPEWASEAEKAILDALGDMGRETYAQLGLDPEAFSLDDPAVVEWAKDKSFAFATDVVDTTAGTIRESLAEALDAGESYEDIARRLQQHYATWCGDDGDLEATRAMVIARTETVAAQNAGVLQGFAQSGVVEGKVWMTIGDANVRASHAAIDGEIVGLDSRFSNGLRFPGDPENGAAADRINCRCTMQPAIQVEE
jgi:SPP1 gp7 family putative phage head morphogenesis protein